MMNAKKQWTQAECDEANALREYERIHAEWMNTSIFDNVERQARIKNALAIARENYLNAKQAAHPDWIIF